MASVGWGATPRTRIAEHAFRWVTVMAAVAILVALLLAAVATTGYAIPAFRHEGWRFVTSATWDPASGRFGALAPIYGTVLVSSLAVALAIPVSVGLALFITDVAPRRRRAVLVSLTDLLAAVPSVVFGLWGLLVLAPALDGPYRTISRWAAPLPVLNRIFGDSGGGRGFLTAGIVLAVMIVPIITSVAREVFAACPQAQRDSARALGATRWEVLRTVVLPSSRSGLMGAVMLGLGRAIGETIAVALVIGSSAHISANLFGSGDAMPSIIANQWGGENVGMLQHALMGLGVVLFGLTLALNAMARLVVRRSAREVRAVSA
jgi:phosphate transport system permease protein